MEKWMRYLFVLLLLFTLASGAHAADVSDKIEHINRHILAYNDNDAEAYAAFFHEDIEVYNFPAQVLTSGRNALIQSSGKTFKDHQPGSVIINTIELKDKVITHERASFTVKGVRRTVEIVKIYQFQNGLIRRMTFLD